MTGTIRDTDGGIESGQAVRDGREIASRAGHTVLRVGVVVCVLLLAGSLFAGVAAAEESSEIGNWTELQEMEPNGDYVLVADLDEHTDDYSDVVGDGSIFDPIGEDGNAFTGTFDGNDHTISNLTITSGDDYVGLFGYVGETGELTNVSLEAVDIEANSRVGGLAGENHGSILHSYATGSVEVSSGRTGGLVGVNSKTISNSYAAASADGPIRPNNDGRVGGLVGENTGSGEITNSYASGAVSTFTNVGGLVGVNSGEITASYAIGSVTGARNMGGLVGSNTDSVVDSYWNIETTGQPESAGGTGLTTLQMTGDRAEDTMTGFEFGNPWEVDQDDPEDGLTIFYPTLQNTPHNPQPSVTLFDGGNGTEGSPYQISDWEQLDNMRLSIDSTVVSEDAHFELTADLDEDSPGYEQVAGPDANDDDGFDPIGNDTNTFEGTFDGSGYTISDLTIMRGGDEYIGLFGSVGQSGTLTTVSLEAVDIEGNQRVGGLVGANSGTITASYATGSVDGSGDFVGGLVGQNTLDGTVKGSYATGFVDGSGNIVGGLVGENSGTIEQSYATGSVDGFDNNEIGGLVGYNDGGTITESYATSSVDGNEFVGGLVGFNSDGTVTKSYATGSANGSDFVGGLVGLHANSASTITESYATGLVMGAGDNVGGLVGVTENDATASNSYWNLNTTRQTESANGIGLTTLQMTDDRAVGNMTGFDFVDTWETTPDGRQTRFYPTVRSMPQIPAPSTTIFAGGVGTEESPYQIADWNQLDSVRLHLESHFVLVDDLDAETPGYEIVAGPEANDDTGFNPIGDTSNRFEGTFDGSEYTISNLTIINENRHTGLFGFVDNSAELTNISLESVHIEGNNQLGGLAGENEGTITASYVTGSVEGAFAVGGLVGQNSGTITRSYATVDTSGSIEFVGGLVGWNDDGTITESYATGSVDSSGDRGFVGGLVGYNSDDGAIGKSYATGTTNGSSFVGGLVGASEQAIIEESYATGSVESTGNNVGGLIGLVTDDTTTNSYWDLNTTGQNKSANGTGLTTEQMTGFSPETTMEPLTSSDFSITDGYPLLDWSIDDLTLTLAATGLNEGDTTDATVSLAVVDDRTIPASETADYTTGDDSVATVDTGTVTAEGSGSTTITATVAAVSDDLSLSVTSAPSPSGGGGGGGGGGAPPAPSGTTVTVDDGSGSDSTADDDASDSSDGDEASRPDTRISVSSPQPGQRLVIEGSNAFISSGEDDSEPAPSGDDGAGDDRTTDGSDDTDDGSTNVRSDRLSVNLNTDRNFELSVTTYETDLRRSLIRGGGQPQQSVDPLFASRASVPAAASTTPEIVAPEAVSAAAAAFERDTQSVSAGYLNVEHTLEPEEIAGATFEFSIRQSYLDELGVDADGVTLYHQVDGEWEPRETEQTDADDTHYRFEGTMESFSVFALGTEAAPIGVTEASLSDESVETGETTTVSATVENRGQHRAEHTLELTADGEIVATEIVSLDGGEIAETTLSFEPLEGEYAMAVDRTEAGTLTVGEGEPNPSWLWLLIGLGVLIAAVLWRRSQNTENEKQAQ